MDPRVQRLRSTSPTYAPPPPGESVVRLTIVGVAAMNDVSAVLKSSGRGGGGGEGEEGSALQQLQANPAYSSALLSSKFS